MSSNMNQADLHNRMVIEIIKLVIKPTMESGGDGAEVFYLLESVVTGVISLLAKPGTDEIAIDRLCQDVKMRLAAKALTKDRLAVCETAGAA